MRLTLSAQYGYTQIMKTVNRSLRDCDHALLPILAGVWDVPTKDRETPELIEALSDAMLDAERAGRAWSALDDKQRGALQMLISSGGVMPAAKFARLFGEIRQMGSARIEREKPHENPENVAEALFYRGMIAQAFEHTGSGARAVVYVPNDLAERLPTHQTAYDNLDVVPAGGEVALDPHEDVGAIRQADTTLVDDLTTLLAYLQLHSPPLDEISLAAEHHEALRPHLLKADETRLAFMLGLGIGAGVIDAREGRARPERAGARRWLSASRALQVRFLAEAWQSSTIYRELWHVPGLHPEPGGGLDDYEPSAGRGAALDLITQLAPQGAWWSLDEFIEAVKVIDPDFQRPGGDYDSWYIRNDAGDYLQGFESWDAVEGALLEFYVLGPMHWLGLVDLTEDAARLTAYGRAFIGEAAWPTPPDPDDRIIVQGLGTLRVSRKIPRIDRFQVARFTTWDHAGDPYIYRLDAASIERAAAQGITTEHIAAFISRVLDDEPMPEHIARLLQVWREGPTSAVTFEHLLVLRTTAPETLDFIVNTPALRRHVGARLGPMAVIIRADEADALREALGEHGIQVEQV